MALFLRGFLLSPHKKRSAKGAYLVYFLYNSYYYIYYTSQGLESWNPRSKHSITIGTAAIRERPEECMNPKIHEGRLAGIIKCHLLWAEIKLCKRQNGN